MIKRFLGAVATRWRRLAANRRAVVRVNPGSWKATAQEGEFQFHKTSTWRQTDEFRNQSERLFEHFGLMRDDYAGKTVVDLGAGSMLRTKYFSKSALIAIEPLAARFVDEIPWSDLNEVEYYSAPAEERLSQCVGRADLIVSINVLDHCYSLEEILSNIRDYLKPNGMAFVSFDKHLTSDEMHPLHLDEEVCARLFARAGLSVERFTTGMGEVLVGGAQTYGHGPYTLNYWLKRGEQRS
jgi:2-polyprenyl-3-methyl-5-hydroxy-6-metoxy-1,4-benzoquinol methylase